MHKISLSLRKARPICYNELMFYYVHSKQIVWPLQHQWLTIPNKTIIANENNAGLNFK